MVKKILFLLIVILISPASCQEVLADIINFNIAGTYGQGLTDKNGVTLFSTGDTFSIQGSFDTALQPHMETKADPDVVLTNISFPPFYFQYASIVNLTHNIPLSQINVNYPSDENAKNNNDYKNGSYFLTTNFPVDGSGFYLANNFTELSISNVIVNGVPSASGFINYNYHVVYEKEGDFTIVRSVHDEISLNVTEFRMTVVPLPAPLLLFSSGVAGLIWLRRKRR
jgi:hypothetical protein